MGAGKVQNNPQNQIGQRNYGLTELYKNSLRLPPRGFNLLGSRGPSKEVEGRLCLLERVIMRCAGFGDWGVGVQAVMRTCGFRVRV